MMKVKIDMRPTKNGRSGFRQKADRFNSLKSAAFYRGAAMVNRRLFEGLKVLPGLIAVIACLSLPVTLLADDAGTNAVEVKIDNFNFTPPALTIPVGTKVTWVNKDDVPHTVTSDDKFFGSRALDTDDKFSFTFQTTGTYSYYCSVHPKMIGKVIVK